MPKILSFFSGAGFLDLGFEFAGFEVIFSNEYHEPFSRAYRHSREKLHLALPRQTASSITEFASDLSKSRDLASLVKSSKRGGELVGFIGGPPCPDFSVGGRNRGRHGENGKLSLAYVQLICEHKPDFFLFENVKGLWRTKMHRAFFEELKVLLWNAGYRTSERLINSIEFGVPQDRDRIILLGFRDSVDSARSFVMGGLSEFFPWEMHALYPSRRAFSIDWPTTKPFYENDDLPKPAHLPSQLTVEHWFQANAVEEHSNAEHCFKPRAGLARFKTVQEGDDSRKSYKRLHRWRYSPTACYGNNEVHLHPYKARRISVAEALAIQSAPPGFELPSTMTLSDMFKTVGNGVPVKAAHALACTIKSFIEGSNAKNYPSGDRARNQPFAEESGLHIH
ncbi:MAG: DNA cytosine methyltransferase [Candidatus Angelobacter sp.]